MEKIENIPFIAKIEIIGINPFVFVPAKVLEAIFKQAGKEKGAIPIKGTINDKPYTQTLVKYSGAWRLYINTTMLKDSPKRIGEKITVTVQFDSQERLIAIHPKLAQALSVNVQANSVFERLSPSRQGEIARYINKLKNEKSVEENVVKAIQFLLGNGPFAGRNKP